MFSRTPEVIIILHVLIISVYFLQISVAITFNSSDAFDSVHIHHTLRLRGPMAREFLTAHNNIRAKYHTPPLKWDKRLARMARRHAGSLERSCTMVHSGSQYGENLFWGKLSHWTPTRMVEDWANEARFFDMKTKKCTRDWTECGHFTQLIWARTQRVGCSRKQCPKQAGFIGICIYDPPGNAEHQSPFV